MRKAIKNSLLEIFKTIYEAHEIIKGFIDKREYENAQNLLVDCQDTAIQIGNCIEESEGEGFVTVSFLVEYCEALYEVATNLSEESSGYKVQKQLDKKIIKAENSVKNDVKVKLEVVFMPYKASMWDSLESIWKAADEDPDCDAYVVPIPYYDRKPDHSFGELHYEGREYPDYVPVVHYKTYDLEQRRPDIIYIHNPYDGNNFVTSVDPRFYTSELKKYTERLVYVPYFVVSDGVPEHFCTTAACVNADFVVVQSEKIRKQYIESFAKAYKWQMRDLEEKFIALGSPKFDCVANAKKENYPLPEEWAKLIQGKKVILYNTSVSSILNGNEQYLKKICSVLKWFLSQEDVVLWWRPHPLSVAVYDSMRNTLLNTYVKLIEQYKHSGKGIYDDTSDLHRAICLSDAYYGDRSSLVALYQLTGKPIMIQDVNVCEYDDMYVDGSFEDIFDDGENLWFTTLYYNALFKMSKENMKPQLVGMFPGKKDDAIRLYSNITKHNDKLYFAPFAAKNIAVYDLENNAFNEILVEGERSELPDCDFYSIVADGDTLYFIPYGYSAIVGYNTITKEIAYYDDWLQKIKNSKYYDAGIGYFRSSVTVGRKLYLPCICSNQIVIFDLDLHQSEVIEVIDKDYSFHGVCYSNDKLWFSSYKGQAVCMDINTKESKIITLPCGATDAEFMDVCNANDKILLYPYYADSIVSIDVNTEIAEVYQSLDSLCSAKTYNGHYMFAKCYENKIYSMDLQNEQLVIYDIQSETFDRIDICISPENAEYLFEKKLRNVENVNILTNCADTYNYNESSWYNIADIGRYFADKFNENEFRQAALKRSDVRKRTLSNSDGTAGKKIHKYIKDRC